MIFPSELRFSRRESFSRVCIHWRGKEGERSGLVSCDKEFLSLFTRSCRYVPPAVSSRTRKGSVLGNILDGKKPMKRGDHLAMAAIDNLSPKCKQTSVIMLFIYLSLLWARAPCFWAVMAHAHVIIEFLRTSFRPRCR